MKLSEALPELVADLEAPLSHLGRPDLIAQLRQAVLEGWKYDDFADAVYLRTSSEEAREVLSLYDELGVNLELDAHGRLCRIEVMGGQAIASRLASA